MSNQWPTVRLSEVLRRSEETVTLQPDAEYRQITVRLWGNGVVERRRVNGATLAGSRRFLARTGQFIASRIDARNGAMGLVPPALDGAIVTNDFPLFDLDKTRLVSAFIGWLSRTRGFVERCQRASEGTTNRVRLQENKFLALEIPLPPLAEQRRVVARIEELAAQIHEAHTLRHDVEKEQHALLQSVFRTVIEGAAYSAMHKVAPVVRRPVEVDFETSYPELGVRSFGKGTFHKTPVAGVELGSKRLFCIEPGDLVFNNVFAWEGAVAVARKEDAGRFGSHRFITCIPKSGVATASFLCFYLLTPEGLEKLGRASPGGAGRNRTLGLDALMNIAVPVPEYSKQMWFNRLQEEVNAARFLQAETAAELDALLPSILDRAFGSEL